MNIKGKQYKSGQSVELIKTTPPPKTPPQPNFDHRDKKLQVFHTFEIHKLNEFLKTIPLNNIVNRYFIPLATNSGMHFIVEYVDDKKLDCYKDGVDNE